MKRQLGFLLALGASVLSMSGQGVIAPVPPVFVTNGVSGGLAGVECAGCFQVGLYAAPAGTENFVLTAPLLTISPFSGAVVDPVPGGVRMLPFPAGSQILVQLRAWNGNYPSYEQAVASGDPTVLAGFSIIASVTPAGPIPPLPVASGLRSFTVYPVPEPRVLPLMSFLALVFFWRRRGRTQV